MRALSAFVMVLAVASAASAQDRPSDVAFKPRYHGVTTAEWIAVPSIGVFAAVGFFVPPRDRTSGPWTNAVDAAVRDELRLSTRDLRSAAGITSDLLVAGIFAWEGLDAWLMAALVHGDAETAETLTFLDAETHFVVAGLQNWTAVLGSRERPFGATCGPIGMSTTPDLCNGDFRDRSFFSGHTSHAFAGAALTCTHHAFLPGLGGRGDPMPCLATLGVATLTGALRVLADMHWLSDVLTGAVVGSLAGFLVPYLLHYMQGEDVVAGTRIALVPFGAGAGLVGMF